MAGNGPAPRGGVAHLIAAPSVMGWFSYFASLSDADRVVLAGEAGSLPAEALSSLLSGQCEAAVFYSSHETLLRDADVASRLRGRGYRAFSQSPRCARLGYDKFAMKEFFDAAGVRSPQWAAGAAVGSLGSRGLPIVVKKRSGTQSQGTRLSAVGTCTLARDEFAEKFSDGTEYSVVAYRDEHGTATFPPVWKGPVSKDLIPPWRRLRLCPYPDASAGMERDLRSLAVRIIEESGGWGFMEIEVIVAGRRDILALEINPRVSGTMRISAMATGLPIFSLYRMPGQRGHLEAVAVAGEVPYDGPPVCDPGNEVFGTSRLTAAGRDLDEVTRKLRDYADMPGPVSMTVSTAQGPMSNSARPLTT